MNRRHIRRIAVALISTLAVVALASGCPDEGGDDMDTGMVADTGFADTGMEDTGMEDTGMADAGMGEGFNFRSAGPEDYDQIDRIGMPAVSTALAGIKKDAYNRGTPRDDVNMTFVPTVVQNLEAIHTWFDPDLQALQLTRCSMMDADNDNLPDCVGQEVAQGGPTGASLVIPDTLTLDTSAQPGFPNGRTLPDPVIDVTLAVILLDMSNNSPTTFAQLPLNPPENDVNMGEFPDDFPYLLPPHEP